MPDDLNREIGRQKDKWRQEFRDTRAEITRLQSHLTDLKRKLYAADEILASAKLQSKPSSSGKYSGMGLRQAVRQFFVEHPYTQHSISDVKARLEHEGMKTDHRDLRANIAMVCRRLESASHFLTSELRHGSRFYQLKGRPNLQKQTGAGKPTPAVQNVFEH